MIIIGKKLEKLVVKATGEKPNTRDIYDLPLELQPVALTMLSLGEGTIKEIAHESNIKIKDLQLRLEQLQHLGYLGKKEKKVEKEAIFFCLTY